MLPTVCPVATTSTDLATYSSRNHSLFTCFRATPNFILTKPVKSTLSSLFPRLERSTLCNYPSSRRCCLPLRLLSPFSACFTAVPGFLRWDMVADALRPHFRDTRVTPQPGERKGKDPWLTDSALSQWNTLVKRSFLTTDHIWPQIRFDLGYKWSLSRHTILSGSSSEQWVCSQELSS